MVAAAAELREGAVAKVHDLVQLVAAEDVHLGRGKTGRQAGLGGGASGTSCQTRRFSSALPPTRMRFSGAGSKKIKRTKGTAQVQVQVQ